VCAAVVRGASDGPDEDTLRDFARTHLAPAKRPKTWAFPDELPRTLTGKVRRTELSREDAQADVS
jgi:long-chain acyl-CoA synthetase